MRDGKFYLRRHYLTPRVWHKRVFLHHIVLPDPDAHMHDHPWDFKTRVLRGWYKESFIDGPVHGFSCKVAPGQWYKRPATFRHRITEVSPGGVWTLVVADQAEREWGFWVGGKWLPWHQYLGQENVVAAEDRIAR
jgi:hypothetical protein